MEKVYYIYHIPGIKIGVCQNQELRIQKQQKFNHWEILEEHTDIYLVSDREKELQRQYGYKVDKIPYWKIIENAKKLTPKKIESNRQTLINSNVSVLGGLSKSYNKVKAAKLNMSIATEASRIRLTCPHCNKDANTGNYSRWHGVNCKTIRGLHQTENQSLQDPSYLDPYHL